MKLWLITSMILVLTTLSVYTQDEVKPELTARQLQVKLEATEDQLKTQRLDSDRKFSSLLKEKQNLDKTIDLNNKEIEKLKKEIEKLKLEIEAAKPKPKIEKPTVVKETPKIVHSDLDLHTYSACLTDSTTPPNEVMPKIIKSFYSIQIDPLNPGAFSYSLKWDAGKKEILVGFGEGETVRFNINDENQLDINNRLKAFQKYKPENLDETGKTKFVFQTEFKDMSPIQSCIYSKDSDMINSIIKPTTMKMRLQNHYFNRSGFGWGMVIILCLAPEKSEFQKYVIFMLSPSDASKLSKEISKYYDPIETEKLETTKATDTTADTTRMANDSYNNGKAREEAERKAKGLKTYDEAAKEAGLPPLEKSKPEEKKDPWQKYYDKAAEEKAKKELEEKK